MTIFKLVVALAVFLIVILFHEAGHFFAAKKVGIRVNEFSVGMGPALWQNTKGETIYSLRAIPLGGYCAMEGEEETSDAPDSFRAALPWKRFVTVFAGPFVNLVIAYLCFALFLGVSGLPVPTVDSVQPGSPAESAGLLPGDTITSINGIAIESGDSLTETIQKESADGQPLSLTILRNASEQSLSVTPTQQDGQSIIGIVMQQKRDLFGAILGGWSMLWSTFASLFQILWRLITGGLSINALSGPIGVVSLIGQAAAQGFAPVLYLTGYISLNLAFFNLLPIPALDGFTLLFILIEKLRGKPLSVAVEEKVKMAGFVLLLGLIVFVSFKDVMRLL